MEDLSTVTSQLKETLLNLVDSKNTEEIIFEHISAAEKLYSPLEDFPSDLDWFNTSEPLSSAHLQGKIVVLDFFTYCCVNCLHIIPHLRELEENFLVTDGVVVIGVHSAKFDNEKNSQNILLALQRYNICHPVVNDKDCYIWNKLAISCWPTIVILGPSRQPLFSLVGEGHIDELWLFLETALKFYKNSISPHVLPVVSGDQIVTSTLLKFPGKIAQRNDVFAVSDSGNHRIIIFDGDGYIKFKIGGKTPGFKDGSFESSRFNSPQGLAFYDSDEIYVADTENHAVRLISLRTRTVSTVVGNGRQGVDYEGGKLGLLQKISSPWDVCVVPCEDVEVPVVRPVVSLGTPFPPPLTRPSVNESAPPPPPTFPQSNLPPPPPAFPQSNLPSPPPAFPQSNLPPPPPSLSPSNPPPPPSLPSGDFPPPASPPTSNPSKNSSSKVLLIAASGTHQIWAYFIEKTVWWKGKSYDKNICVAVAGSGKEENRNNRYPMMASFAQPSGLTYSKEFKSVFIADSESSSIRRMSLRDGSVSHVVGGARSPDDLFSYGDADGEGYDAKLQHPLGVIWSSKENCLFVCDTYNHKVKKVSVVGSGSWSSSSLHKSRDLFCEPSGGCLNESEDLLYVCDTNNNCVKTIRLADGDINKLEVKGKPETTDETPLKGIWETETSLSRAGGTLNLKIEFSPAEIHGKWKAQVDDSKVTAAALKGKLTTNKTEFTFSVRPSDADDVFHLIFDLVLCANETCFFKKLVLKVLIRRTEIAKEFAVCEVKKNLL